MSVRRPDDPALLEKMRALSPEKLAEVEDFVEFLLAKDDDKKLRQAALKLSEASLAKVWDNADDAAYDQL